MKEKQIKIDDLLPVQALVSKDKIDGIRKRIGQRNMDFRITVIEADEKGKYYITNGHHRTRVLFEDGKESIPAKIRKRQDKEPILNYLKTHNYKHISELEVVTSEKLRDYFNKYRNKECK